MQTCASGSSIFQPPRLPPSKNDKLCFRRYRAIGDYFKVCGSHIIHVLSIFFAAFARFLDASSNCLASLILPLLLSFEASFCTFSAIFESKSCKASYLRSPILFANSCKLYPSISVSCVILGSFTKLNERLFYFYHSIFMDEVLTKNQTFYVAFVFQHLSNSN